MKTAHKASQETSDADMSSDPSHMARLNILEAALPLAAFDGWTDKTLRQATQTAELPAGAQALYFPGGAVELIGFWAQCCDQDVLAHIDTLDLETMRIRDKVTQGVWARCEAIGPHVQAARRAMSRLALPDALGQGPAQIWASADVIWRAIGDTSTDANFYSKRAILSGVIGSSLMSWMSDNSADKAEARAFLDARIDNVMQFESAKFKFKTRTQDWPRPAEFLGRLRYGRSGRRSPHWRRPRGT